MGIEVGDETAMTTLRNCKAAKILCAVLFLFAIRALLIGQQSTGNPAAYEKNEYRIPMRDGAKLFTSVYAPMDDSKKYPILMTRTPYSIAPYGPNAYRRPLGPSAAFA